MKHLLLDVSTVLDLWLKRGKYWLVDTLFEQAEKQDVRLWISASSIPMIEYIFTRELAKDGADREEAKNLSRKLFAFLFKHVNTLSNLGFEQNIAIEKAYNLEDAQTALSLNRLHGEKIIVTDDADFDTLGLARICSISEALTWLECDQTDGEQATQFIDLAAQQDTIRPLLEKSVHTVLHHGRYILGPEVQEFEEKLAEFVGVRHCIGVSSGTDALLMCLMAQNIGPGDAVFTTPFTFIATAEVISLLGATPVFVDIDPRTFNIDPAQLKKAVRALKKNDNTIHPLPFSSNITLKPKAIIPVDLFGLPADYDPIMQLAKEHNLFVLADSAQGLGSEYKGYRAGSLAHATTTSFFPAKPLGCYGDGGAILTDNDALAEKLVSIRVHGKGRDKYDNIRIGLNARLHTMQASILIAKLETFATELEAKQRVAQQYTERLSSMTGDIKPPYVPGGLKSAWAQYSILTDKQTILQKGMKKNGIPSAIYYKKPLHLQPAFYKLNYKKGDMPVSENVSQQICSIPMHAYIKSQTLQRITNTICMILSDNLL